MDVSERRHSARDEMAAVYSLLQRSAFLRPYLPAKKYDSVSADDDVPPAPVPCAAGDERQCRICLSTDDEEDLISPCLCAGSVRWVHRRCLDEWRAQGIRPNAFAQCELCQFAYETEARERPVGARLRFHLLVARDLCAMFGGVQLVIVLQAAALRAADVHGRLAAKMPASLSHPFAAWYCLSLLMVLAFIGLLGMCVACSANDAPAFLCLYDPWLSASTGDCLFAGYEGGEVGALCAGALFVLLLVLVVIGVACSVFFATFVFSYVVRRHVDLSQRRDEARHTVVLDLAASGGQGGTSACGGESGGGAVVGAV